MTYVDDLYEPNDREPSEPDLDDEELDDLDGSDYYDPHAT